MILSKGAVDGGVGVPDDVTHIAIVVPSETSTPQYAENCEDKESLSVRHDLGKAAFLGPSFDFK